MTIYYRSRAIGDPGNTGLIKLGASMKREFAKASIVYCLGAVPDKGVAYATAPAEELAPVQLDTLPQLADRIDYLAQTPVVFDYAAKLANVATALRAFVIPAAGVDGPSPAAGPVPLKLALAPFNNGKAANGATWFGASLGDGKHDGSGWPKGSDIDSMVALGVKCIRLPIKPIYCVLADGSLNTWVIKNLSGSIKRAIAAGVSVVLDAHTYLFFNDPAVWSFWSLFGPAIEKAIGGPSPMFGIELANETGEGSKDLTKWTEPLRTTIKAIRVSGYQGYIFAGAGDWNNMTFLPKALAEVERTGGVLAMDPYDRTIYTGHDYWNWDTNSGKRRNDQGTSVLGTIDIAQRYDPALTIARRIKAKIAITEIGGGISPNGPFPAFNGVGKNGQQLQDEFFAYAHANEDVLIGAWFWMAGKTSVGYRHKIEAGNPHTVSLQRFWAAR